MIRESDFYIWIKQHYADATFNGKPKSIKNVVKHSDKATADSLFVCIRGIGADGHDYAKIAYQNGCRTFLCERELSLPADACIVLVRDVRDGLFKMLSDFYKISEGDFEFCAVTGTKGKTTTAMMLMHLLNKHGYKAACSTTLGLCVGSEMWETENTTPDLFVIVPWLSRLKKQGIRYVVIEVSSAALSGERLRGMRFAIGVLTSFSEDHVGVGEHESLEDYLAAKRSLFSSYGIKMAIFPREVSVGKYIVRESSCVIGIPSDEEEISNVTEREQGQCFIYKGREVLLSLPGRHNRTNARLALTAAAILTGKSEEEFISHLSDLCIPGRYEQFVKNGVSIVIDYAHNQESFFAVAKTAKRRSRGRVLAVFGSVGERGEGRRQALAHAADTLFDYSVITADNPGCEDAFHICAEIYAAFSDKSHACIVADREHAIRHAFSLCEKGDTLLLLGKGHEGYQKTKNGCIPFSERSILFSDPGV